MAVQAAEGQVKASGPDSSGVSPKVLIFAILLALLIGLGGAVAFFTFAEKKNDGASREGQGTLTGSGGQQGAEPTEAGTGSLEAIVDLEPFIVNLADYPEARYLKVTVKVAIDQQEAQDTLLARMAPIRDTILVLLSSKESGDLRTPQGKFQLRDEITKRINAVLPAPIVKNTYFTEFVVQ